MNSTIGLLLAAGAGRRMGMPKALVAGADGVPWVVSAARALADGGCSDTVVVIGSRADDVRAVLAGAPVTVVEALDWDSGMGASLAAGLDAIGGRDADAALIHLVDLPDVGADVIERLRAHAAPSVLARASYRSGPGHPVLIGREHWAAIAQQAGGDEGARGYLRRQKVESIDCSDLAIGHDVDHPGSMLGT